TEEGMNTYYYDKTNEGLAVKGTNWEWYREAWAEEYCRQVGKQHPVKVIKSLQWLVRKKIVKEITVKGMKILPKKDYLLSVSEEGEISIYESVWKIRLPAGRYTEGENYEFEKVRDAKGKIEYVVMLIPLDQQDKEWHDLEKYEIKIIDEWLEEKIAELDKEWNIEGIRLELGELKKDWTEYDEYGYERYIDVLCYVNVVKNGCVIHRMGFEIDATPRLRFIDYIVRRTRDEILVLEHAVKGTNWKWGGEGWVKMYFIELGTDYPARVIESLQWLVREGLVKEINLGSIKIVPEKEYLLSTSEDIYEILERSRLEPKIIDDKLCTFYKVKNVKGYITCVMKFTPINKEPSECPDMPEYEAITVKDWLRKKLERANREMWSFGRELEVSGLEISEEVYVIQTIEKSRVIEETYIKIQDLPEALDAFVEEYTRPAREKELKLQEMIKNDPVYRTLQQKNT
ncbi:MAG: hypothetical protein ACTSPV_19685, partial [Candidatus Hodarchaeales archaeon]